MPRKITEDCIACGVCEPECPNGAISEGPDTYVIDPNKCTDCAGDPDGPKCEAACPNDAIVAAS